MRGHLATGAARGRRVLWRCRPGIFSRRSRRDAATRAEGNRRKKSLTQERPLKPGLESPREIVLRGKNQLEMFDGLQERVRLRARRCQHGPTQQRTQDRQPGTGPPHQPVGRFQRKDGVETFPRGLHRRSRQHRSQQIRPQRRGQTVARQHAREEDGEGAAAPAAPAPVRTKHPLAAPLLGVGRLRRIAPEVAVAVQRARLAAVGTTLPLEGKSSVSSSGSSRTKRRQEGVMPTLLTALRSPGRAKCRHPNPRGSIPRGAF